MDENWKNAALRISLFNYKNLKKMETIYSFLHEWAYALLLICVVVLFVWGIWQIRANKSKLKDEDFPVSDEPEDDMPETEEEVFEEEVIKVEEPPLMKSRRFYAKKTYSQTDAVLRGFKDLLPKNEKQLENFRKEWKTLGGKAQMTHSEKTRYAAIGHILTVFEARRK